MKTMSHFKNICLQAINFPNTDILFCHHSHNLLAAHPLSWEGGTVKTALCLEFMLGHRVTNKTPG